MSELTRSTFHLDTEESLLPDSPGINTVPAKLTANLYGRDLKVHFSNSARKAASRLTSPLLLEMELYFSCLVRKQVRFKPLDQAVDGETFAFTEHLFLGFRPVVTEECRIDDLGADAPPVKTMPVKNHRAFVPHWLRVDYHKGNWCGEFGFKP